MKHHHLPTVHTYLNQLTEAHLADLRQFAARRLRRIAEHIPSGMELGLTAEDLVQDVFLDALQGERRPKPASLVSLDAFLHWLRGSLNQHVEAECRTCLFLCSGLAPEEPSLGN